MILASFYWRDAGVVSHRCDQAGPYGGREKRGKWEELGFFSPNGFAFLTVEGGSGKFQGVS